MNALTKAAQDALLAALPCANCHPNVADEYRCKDCQSPAPDPIERAMVVDGVIRN